MKRISRVVAPLFIWIMGIIVFPSVIFADSSIKKNCPVIVNGSEAGKIAVLELNYDNNMYVSLKGIAHCINGTNKQIQVSLSDDEISIATGASADTAAAVFNEEQLSERSTWKLKRTPVYIDGIERRYFSVTGVVGDDGISDVFFSPVRIAMALDMDIKVDGDTIAINTENGFGISDVELENSGYLQGVNSLVIGDGTTGEIYYGYNADKVVPIASTTKLMTYFVLMDAVSNGEVSLEDNVNISAEAVRLSEGIDGLISLDGVSSVPLTELVTGMLLPSCNECALAIAEHVAGSEAAFVDRMNQKAESLQALSAEFYNSNGLPVYEKQLLPAKKQNHMSAKDMFTIVSELVDTYPQVMDITSVKTANLLTLRYEAKNTNALLYNVDGVKGLKTGTTNKSGACVVVALPIEKDGEIHNLLTILYGAEGEYDRALVAELATRISIDELYGTEVETEEKYTITPDDPEVDVERMLRNLK